MRLYKIISFSVAILLITVFFASVVAVPAAAQSAQLTLSTSNPNPAVGKSVTFTATLKSGNTLLSSKSVTIYHYFNGVRYNDVTKATTNGQITLTQSFSSTGQRTYYATFAGDSTYQTSTSSVVTINVTGSQTTTTTLAASPTTAPTVGSPVTFTATLKGGFALSSKPVTIYHYFNGVKYTDTTTNTNSAGQIALTQSFSSTGQRTYSATFAGDSTYASSTSSVVNINAGGSQSSSKTAMLSLAASPTTAPAIGSPVTFTATLKSGSTAISGQSVTIYHYFNGVNYTDTTKTTNANGQITLTQSFSSTGQRTYSATFAGDSTYASSTSSVVTINVGGGNSQTTTTTLAASPTTTPTVGSPVTFTATLKSDTTLLSGKSVTIYHYFNGVKYTDTTTNTNSAGQITLTQSFGSTGQRTYSATFAGDSVFQTSTSSITTINVGGSSSQTIYYVPQAGSSWTNQGTAGTSYNAYVSTPSLFQTQSNGYPYWGVTGKNDFICIPSGSATNNQNVVSWEIGFHFAGNVSDQRYQKIWDKAYGGFSIVIDTGYGPDRSYLVVNRVTTGGIGARWYIPTDTVIRAGHNYYVQIAWDSSAGPGKEPYPTIWIGEDGNAPVHQMHWDESAGALDGIGSWYDDSVGSAELANTSFALPCGSDSSAKTAWLNGGIFVYRQYNSIVDFSSGGSWNTDKLALTT